MKQLIDTLKTIWNNRWFKFGLASLVYILWFVIWTRNLWWLLGVAVIYDLYITRHIDKLFLHKYKAYKQSHTAFRKVMEWAEALLYAVVVVVPLKIYFFGMYVIPSSSMEQSLLVGDYIYVNKVAYGPKMPNTPLSFPFVHNTLPFTKTTPSYLEWLEWPYKRLAGCSEINRGDVVVFNFPEGDTVALGVLRMKDNYTGETIENDVSTLSYYELLRSVGREELYRQTKVLYRPVDKRENYIKRCVGLPGDTLEVREGDLYINGQRQQNRQGVQYLYLLWTHAPIPQKTFERLGVNSAEDVYYSAESGEYNVNLTVQAAGYLSKLPQVDTVIRYVSQGPDPSIFPHAAEHYSWTQDNFGPLWIPRAGATVQLTPKNISLYRRAICTYEGNVLEIEGDEIYINGSSSSNYTFRMNYYFMMGDNRHNSADSRFWGFVPEDHIEGKASFVWLSIARGKNIFTGLRWGRMFTRIN